MVDEGIVIAFPALTFVTVSPNCTAAPSTTLPYAADDLVWSGDRPVFECVIGALDETAEEEFFGPIFDLRGGCLVLQEIVNSNWLFSMQ